MGEREILALPPTLLHLDFKIVDILHTLRTIWPSNRSVTPMLVQQTMFGRVISFKDK